MKMLCRCGHRVIGTVIWNWGICEVEYVLMCILYQCGLVISVYGNFILVSVIQMCTMYTLVGFVLINAFYKNKWCFHFMAVVLTLILTYSFQLDNMWLIRLIHPNTFRSEAQFTTVPERQKVHLSACRAQWWGTVLKLSPWRGLRSVSASWVPSSEHSVQVN